VNLYQIDWRNPTAPPSFVVADNITEAAKLASSAFNCSKGPADSRGVAGVSLLGQVLNAADCVG
jgi:hypothetical protein